MMASRRSTLRAAAGDGSGGLSVMAGRVVKEEADSQSCGQFGNVLNETQTLSLYP
jgi:hypothetical protein